MSVLDRTGTGNYNVWHRDWHEKRLSKNRDSVEYSRLPWRDKGFNIDTEVLAKTYSRAPDPVDWSYSAIKSWDNQ
jgi:hypothetical protein